MLMNYEAVVNYIYNLRRFGDVRLRLERVEQLLKKIGDPHKKMKIIHVGGTNGKGSTVAMISSILKEDGYRVGSFTSPHLSSYRERIVVNNEKISEEEILRLFTELKPIIDEMSTEPVNQPSFFEVTTTIALKYFSEQKVDFAVLEVGLGGRLDATNVVQSLVSVITNIGLEHTDILGNNSLEIAREKAGIIKENSVLITATENDEVYSLFEKICKEKNSKIFRVGEDIKIEYLESMLEGQRFQVKTFNGNFDNLFVPLLGSYQLTNVATAVGAIEALKFYGINIPKSAVVNGLKKVKWPGRFEIVQQDPIVVLDCAKDPLAARSLNESLVSFFKNKRIILVISISRDKKIELMMKEILPAVDTVIITEHKVMGRATEPSVIAEEVKKYSKSYEVVEDVKDAVKKAISIAGNDDVVCVTGSLFTVGEARELWYPEVDFRWGREFNEVRLEQVDKKL